jgi:hypothetical protein
MQFEYSNGAKAIGSGMSTRAPAVERDEDESESGTRADGDNLDSLRCTEYVSPRPPPPSPPPPHKHAHSPWMRNTSWRMSGSSFNVCPVADPYAWATLCGVSCRMPHVQ